MTTLFVLFSLIAALIHIYIFYLELPRYGSEQFIKVFKIEKENIDCLRAPFNNLGVYNLTLALFILLGLMGKLIASQPYYLGVANGLLIVPLVIIVVAGAYLFCTAYNKRRPALIQAIPALLALLFWIL